MKKPGRKPMGKVALTAAERAARYRAARRDAAEAAARRPEKFAESVSDAAILDALRIAIAEGHAGRVWELTGVLRRRYKS
jgi:hypothetical protein